MPDANPAKSILIADDDPAVLQLLVEHYRKLGYQVHSAPDGLQLGIMAPNLKPDLIITDLVMPAAGGACAYSRLRSSTITRSTPVIFLTGIPMDKAREMAPKAPGIVLLHKMDSMFKKLDEAVAKMIGPA
ncbi:MAG: response regulator [Elusimicrobia bacterium]|nr:response regulator [Elusimicrobiota bacterium]